MDDYVYYPRIFMSEMITYNRHISALFDPPGFKYEFINVDLMHCGDLGVCLYLTGCVFYDLLFLELKALATRHDEELAYILVL